jgi:hypothetical protein
LPSVINNSQPLVPHSVTAWLIHSTLWHESPCRVCKQLLYTHTN